MRDREGRGQYWTWAPKALFPLGSWNSERFCRGTQTILLFLKVPLSPKCFLNRNKTLFGVDYFGEKISTIGLFLDFLWIFKVRKIAATLVHGRELRKMGLVVVCDVDRGSIGWHSKRKFSAKAVQFERSKMQDGCVVANCNTGNGFSVHTIPFVCDLCPEAKKRRKNMGGLHEDKLA